MSPRAHKTPAREGGDDVRLALKVPLSTKALATLIGTAGLQSFSTVFHQSTMAEVNANEHLRLLYGPNVLESEAFQANVARELEALDSDEEAQPMAEIRVAVPRRTRAIVNVACNALNTTPSALFHQALLRERDHNTMLVLVYGGEQGEKDLQKAIEALIQQMQDAAPEPSDDLQKPTKKRAK